ncbi:MAG: hypothetical protein IPH12_06970 [Saprospirales bacterium]|nr:hypothetical protein [Saprospirales bacterium]
MKQRNIIFLHARVWIALINFTFSIGAFGQTAFEDYYLRSTNYPSFGNLWTLNGLEDGEAQGVTHDDNNWLFTWTFSNTGYMFKVPVDIPINNNVLQNPNVSIVNMSQFSDLTGYWHWGDPDHYKYAGIEYIVVPITGGGTPIIAIFRSSNLGLVAYGELNNQQSTGWCAIHPKTGILYTSEDFDYAPPVPDCDDQSQHFLYARKLLRYEIPWQSLPLSGYIGKISLISKDAVEMLSEAGSQIELYNMQGGEFTPSGEILYISSGSGCCFGKGHGQQYFIDGLRTFDTQTWKEIKRSKNHNCDSCPSNLNEYFDYYYPLGCNGAGAWSPEGLTIWDLDNGISPNVRGKLHVLLFKFHKTGDNRQVFEHFSNQIYFNEGSGIDQSLPLSDIVVIVGDDALPGTYSKPFKTFAYGMNYLPVWNGAHLILEKGNYSVPAPYTINRRLLITSQGGAATIK